VRNVEFYVDDNLKGKVKEEPFEWLWDETIFGRHVIKAIAYDYAGNMAAVEQDLLIFKF
jgi:hypothetical protein